MYLGGGRPAWLLGCAALLTWAVWTADGPLASVILTPVLLWIARRPDQPRRTLLLTIGCWLLVIAPYLIVLSSFIIDPGSYAASALVPMTMGERAARAIDLFATNFEPWRWAFAQPVWFPSANAEVIPKCGVWLATTLGTVVFALGLRRPLAAAGVTRPARLALLCSALLVVAAASNVAFVPVQLSHIHFRTQTISRVWVSIFLAIVGSALCRRGAVARGLAIVMWCAFVALGVWGGVERQRLFAAYWAEHRVEVGSIVRQVPRLGANDFLVLRAKVSPMMRATEADYLARSWATLLYEDPGVAARVVLISDERRTGCVEEGNFLRCWAEGQEACFKAGSCKGKTIPLDHALVMDFDERLHSYVLQDGPLKVRGATGQRASLTPLASAIVAPRHGLSSLMRRICRWTGEP